MYKKSLKCDNVDTLLAFCPGFLRAGCKDTPQFYLQTDWPGG